MNIYKYMKHQGNAGAKSVVHARIGSVGMETLHELASRQGVTVTQALRDLLTAAKEQMAEEAFGPRLEAVCRTLAIITEQQGRLANRVEALVSIVRSVELSQQERERQILESLGAMISFAQLSYAHLLAMVETSSRCAEISHSAQEKIQILRAGNDGHH